MGLHDIYTPLSIYNFPLYPGHIILIAFVFCNACMPCITILTYSCYVVLAPSHVDGRPSAIPFTFTPTCASSI